MLMGGDNESQREEFVAFAVPFGANEPDGVYLQLSPQFFTSHAVFSVNSFSCLYVRLSGSAPSLLLEVKGIFFASVP